MPAVDTFLNPLGGSWNDPSAWSLGSLPGANDDVVINTPSNAAVHLSVTATVNSLQVGGWLVLDGALIVAGTAQVSGRLDLESGSLDAQSGLTINGGQLNFDGAALAGDAWLVNSALNIGTGGTGAANFMLAGASTLTGTIAAGQTVWVRGDGSHGSATLTTVGDVHNAGVIDLQATDSAQDCSVVSSGMLINDSSGLLEAVQGTGGSRSIVGNFTNEGTVQAESGSALVLNNGPTFIQTGGTLAADQGASIAQVGGSLRYTGGAISGEFSTVNTTLDIAASVTDAALIDVRGLQASLVENASPTVTLRVQGSSYNGHATLMTAAGAVNAGTIDLESIQNSWESNLATVGPLVNMATGRIEVRQGSGGNRRLFGSLTNQGTVEVESGVEWLVLNNGSASPVFTQTGGAVTAEGSGDVQMRGGSLLYTGGAITGEFATVNTTLDIAASVTDAALIDVRGLQASLVENASPTVTLRVQGSSYNGHAMLMTAAGAVNAGTIDLESIQNSWESNLATVGPLVNMATGRIEVRQGSGGNRRLFGSLTNQGTVEVESGVELLVLNNGSASPVFTQTGGAVTAEGSGDVQMWDGSLLYTGGAITGAFITLDSTLDIAASVTVPTMLTVRGQHGTLVENASATVTLCRQGSGSNGSAILTTTEGAVNAGIIDLESIQGQWGCALVGSSFTNLAGGQILSRVGSGGPRSLSGYLINPGLIDVAAGTGLDITGVYEMAGGQISGPGDLVNAEVRETAPSAVPTTLVLCGHSTLTTDNLVNTTLWVQGDGANGSSTLTTPSGFTNAGTILLESLDWSGFSSQLVAGGTVANVATGTLTAGLGAGGPTSVTANVVNQGVLSAAAGQELDLFAVDGSLPTLVQAGGSIATAGNVVVQGGHFDYTGGTISGDFFTLNATIDVADSVTGQGIIHAAGSQSVLLNNASWGVTIQLVAGALGANAVLTTADGAVNAGVLTLEADQWYGLQASLVVGGASFTNTATGRVIVSPGGGQVHFQGAVVNNGTLSVGAYTDFTGPLTNTGTCAVTGNVLLTGDLTNDGTLEVAAGGQVELDGSNANVSLVQAGVINADGWFQLDHVHLDFTGGAIAGLGTFRVRASTVAVSAGVTAPSLIEAAGNANVLVDNASGATTIWVQGDNDDQWATLTAAPGATNAGVIRLESVGGWGSFLAIDDTLVNTATGVIAANDGAGTIPGGLVNAGLVAVAADNPVQITGSYVEAGGTVSGPAYFYRATISETASPLVPTTLVLQGSSTLLTDNLSNVVVQVQATGGNATLTTADGVSNAGTILLENAEGSSWAGELVVGDSLENDGQIEVSGPGGHSIAGNLVNFGTLSVAAGAGVVFVGDGAGALTLTQSEGMIAADG
jgi:hypothetical protein